MLPVFPILRFASFCLTKTWQAHVDNEVLLLDKVEMDRFVDNIVALVLSFSRHPEVIDDLDKADKARLADITPQIHALCKEEFDEYNNLDSLVAMYWLSSLQLILDVPISLIGNDKCDTFFFASSCLPTLAAKLQSFANSSTYTIERTTSLFACHSCLRYRIVCIPHCKTPMCTDCTMEKSEEYSLYTACAHDGITMVCSKDCFVSRRCISLSKEPS